MKVRPWLSPPWLVLAKKFYAGRCDQDQTAIIGHTGKCFLQGFFNREIVTYHVLYGK